MVYEEKEILQNGGEFDTCKALIVQDICSPPALTNWMPIAILIRFASGTNICPDKINSGVDFQRNSRTVGRSTVSCRLCHSIFFQLNIKKVTSMRVDLLDRSFLRATRSPKVSAICDVPRDVRSWPPLCTNSSIAHLTLSIALSMGLFLFLLFFCIEMKLKEI